MKSAAEVKRELSSLYNEQPRGWYVFTGRDLKGRFDTLVTHGTDVWLLKEEYVNPYETVGFGVRDRISEPLRLGGHSFGFRPLTEGFFRDVQASLQAGGSIESTVGRALLNDPVPLHRIDTPVALQGPFVHSSHTTQILPKEQQELELKLRGELDRLLSLKYPHLISTYR